MAMDWTGYMGYSAQPQEDIEDDEDFYGFGQNVDVHMQSTAGASSNEQPAANVPADTSAPQSSMHSPRTPSTEDQKKVDQQNKLETLRKKLLAKRATSQRPDTPSKTPVSFEPPQVQNMEQQNNGKRNNQEREQANDEFGLESLLAEGKAAAEAKAARDKQAAEALAASLNAPASIKQQSPAPSQPANTSFHEQQHTKQAEPKPLDIPPSQKPTDPNPNNVASNAHPINTSDPYYNDLALWLEHTRYHDVQYRNSVLSKHKQRQELRRKLEEHEEQAARIAQQLEQLEQNDQTDIESIRAAPAHPHSALATPMAPPPLPQFMPIGEHPNNTNGAKRPHSPEATPLEKSSRRITDSGYRIRGANDAAGGLSRDNSSPLQRRESFSDRRRSFDDRHERDPSLERRQSNDTRDIQPRGNANASGRGTSHNQWPPRDGPRPFNAREREREGRSGFSAVNRISGPMAHSGNANLDLRKGGVRYFMIKSWNHDNVAQAMKDSLWATQEKNAGLLTEAFHTSRHVILLFSVNRSMAFQGYAIMTSPPDPSLPLPTFCNKLNWATSPAFQVRWLAMTQVHFRFVGHLKNTCNPDDEGLPRAVLVGKDGQEISQDAGMGVVEILDMAEQDEGRGRGRLREQRE